MHSSPASGRHNALRGRVIVLAALAVVFAGVSTQGSATEAGVGGPKGYADAFQGQGLADYDTRTGWVGLNSAQRQIVAGLGAHVIWNRFGTPSSLIKYGGYLATGLTGSPADAARSWIRSHAALFRLTDYDVTSLQLVNDSPLVGTPGHAIVFRQRFGGLLSAQDGMITVGITEGKIAYVSSSATGHGNAPPSPTLSPTQAWMKAAASIGRGVSPSAISSTRNEDGWTAFSVAGFATPLVDQRKGGRRVDQRARLVAFPTYAQGVRAAYEVDLLDLESGNPSAYIFFVDANTGQVWFRQNAIDQFALYQTPTTGLFSGSTPDAGLCGPPHNIVVAPTDKRIDVAASALNPANDIVLVLHRPDTSVATSADTLFSPEALDYELTGGDPPGTWYVQVCEFADVDGFDYSGFYAVSELTSPAFPFPPQWNFFQANPPIPTGPIHPPFAFPSTDTRTHSCWTNTPAVPGCTLDLTPNVGDSNLASRVPWDHNVQTNLPNFTTVGNNANTGEGWSTDLVPGPFSQRPVDLDRTYGFFEPADPESPTGALEAWTNTWNANRCNYPQALTPAFNNNDIMASVTNLHAGHNRFHDFAYHLGFTERNFNLQTNNFGNTAPGPYPFGREEDPEIGDVQNGAALPAALGLTRDNANQITLQDGIPGITNQYLFQPIVGFYSPCVDGDLDTSVFGHEYTHAISNRMVGGPDAGLSGYQAGSMGESWSDLDALEYLHEYNLVPTSDENPWAVGVYVTGNKQRGIRDYPLNANPLNYGDLGFDKTGPEVHADGEVWNAVNYDIRQSLAAKYNSSFPESNAALQRQCADGNLPAGSCPGNRRWIQIVYDAFLLQPPNTSMLTARDAYLAADQMRFGGANQVQLWHAFAKRGMGSCSLNPADVCHASRSAFTAGTGDSQPRPSFESPLEGEKTVTFLAKSLADGSFIGKATFYVGDYEARVTPVADTDSSTPLPNTARFVPGTYSLIAQAPGYGLKKFSVVATANTSNTLVFWLAPNYASASRGATATGDGTDQNSLIDDTEATTWDATMGSNVNVSHPQVTVELSSPQVVRAVRLSAMLDVPDPRFTALRQFAVAACDASPPVNADCGNNANFHTIYTSPANAFNSVAPRPVAPDLLLRFFDVTDTHATHLRLIVLNNQCTGGPDFQGDQDNDPANNTNCPSSSNGKQVHVAEFEALTTGVDGAPPPPSSPLDPLATVVKSGPLLAKRGENVNYKVSYKNLGPNPASSAKVVDSLPQGAIFVSATNGGTFDATTGTVSWNLGTVAVDATGSVSVEVRVASWVSTGSVLLNQAEFVAPNTKSVAAGAVTLVT